MIISEADIKSIVVGGDVETLVEKAQILGRKLKDDKLSTSQIRGIFGTVRQIEASWREAGLPDAQREAVRQQAWRQLLLLQPKLAYQARRHTSMAELRDVLTYAIPLIGTDRKRFKHFVDFFEATLAYHVAAGGSTS